MMGDSVIKSMGTEYTDMMVECFPSIRTEELHGVVDNRDLRSPGTIVIHAGKNDLRRISNLDYVTGEILAVVKTAKTKPPTSRTVLSGILRERDVSWRPINNRYD